jgi:hypothetical protein
MTGGGQVTHLTPGNFQIMIMPAPDLLPEILSAQRYYFSFNADDPAGCMPVERGSRHRAKIKDNALRRRRLPHLQAAFLTACQQPLAMLGRR